ncbi:MAG TPA: DUF4194 domain-containing protein [Steroidobacteraceae bacterium]|nr:DUF4194 domain-containing protein [Steroidobacteraceae bacterium]
MNLREYIEDRLESANVTIEEFRELAIRLLNYGVLARDESQTERELYDRFVRIEEVMSEALDLYGLALHHDRRFEYVRVYPPGSSTPGMDKAEEHAFGGSLRARPSQAEVALMLVLRAQYDKAVREGKLDERGFATEPLEAISLAMKNWLNRSLPEKMLERRRVFQRLKQLRLIDYRSEEDLDHSEAWLRIHPMIVEFVGQSAIDALNLSLQGAAPADRSEAESANVS